MTGAARGSRRRLAWAYGALVVAAVTAGLAQAPQTQTPAEVCQRWNTVFAEGAPALERAPSRLLLEAIRGRPVGAALDLGTGQGRNAVFLATVGWMVTGVDISEVAIAQAKQEAQARKATLDLVVADRRPAAHP